MSRQKDIDRIPAGKTVLIVEDNLLCARALGRLVTAPDTPQVIETVASALESLKPIDAIRSLLVDIKLPDGNGFRVVEKARELSVSLPISIITAYLDASNVKAAYELGALFMPKPLDGVDLASIRAVLQGKPYSTQLPLVKSYSATLHLTRRGSEILALALSGLSRDRIGEVLDIAPNTLKVHIGTLMDKFDTNNLQDMVIKSADFAKSEQMRGHRHVRHHYHSFL